MDSPFASLSKYTRSQTSCRPPEPGLEINSLGNHIVLDPSLTSIRPTFSFGSFSVWETLSGACCPFSYIVTMLNHMFR